MTTAKRVTLVILACFLAVVVTVAVQMVRLVYFRPAGSGGLATREL